MVGGQCKEPRPLPQVWVRCSLSPRGFRSSRNWEVLVAQRGLSQDRQALRGASQSPVSLASLLCPTLLPCCSQAPVISLVFTQSIVLSLSPPPDCELTSGCLEPSTELTDSRCSIDTCWEEGREKGEGERQGASWGEVWVSNQGSVLPSHRCQEFCTVQGERRSLEISVSHKIRERGGTRK